jgi:hypothetical protein
MLTILLQIVGAISGPRSFPIVSCRIRKILSIFAFFWLCMVPVAGAFAAQSKAAATTASDPGYIFALAAANHFLHAWQTQDHETGLLMLTDTAKQQTSEDRLRAFFSAGPGVQQGFEIKRGKRLKAGRYFFPVVLFEVTPGARKSHYPRSSQIVVVRTGTDDWAIDKLP